MNSLQQLLRRLFGGLLRAGAPVSLDPQSLIQLGRAVAVTEALEYDCADVYRLLDRYAEARLAGEDTSDWMMQIHAHLERCPDCRAEFEALIHVLRTETS